MAPQLSLPWGVGGGACSPVGREDTQTPTMGRACLVFQGDEDEGPTGLKKDMYGQTGEIGKA